MGKVTGTVEVAIRRDGADEVVKFEGLQVVLFADVRKLPLQFYVAPTNKDGGFEFPNVNPETRCLLVFPAVAEFKGKPVRVQTPSQSAFQLKDEVVTRNARYGGGVVPGEEPQPGDEVEKLKAEILAYTDTHIPEMNRRLVSQSQRPGAVIRRISIRLEGNAEAKAELKRRSDAAGQAGADLATIGASARTTFLAALTNSNDLLDKDLKYTLPAGHRLAAPTHAD